MRKNSRETPESQTDTDTGREAERQSRQTRETASSCHTVGERGRRNQRMWDESRDHRLLEEKERARMPVDMSYAPKGGECGEMEFWARQMS